MLLIGSETQKLFSVSISSSSFACQGAKTFNLQPEPRLAPNNSAREFTGPLPDISRCARVRPLLAAAAEQSQRKQQQQAISHGAAAGRLTALGSLAACATSYPVQPRTLHGQEVLVLARPLGGADNLSRRLRTACWRAAEYRGVARR